MSELEPLEKYVEFVRYAGQQREDPQELIEERVRFAEIIYYHSESDWVNSAVVGRMLNFIVNPEMWNEWKEAGGDLGLFDVDLDDDDGNGNGEPMF